jgi:hypothetical protein
MGGLIARYAVEVDGEPFKSHVRRIVTLGTPHHGALKALRILATGDYLPFGLLAGQLRESARTLPGVYELLPRYRCITDGAKLRQITPSDLASLGARRERAEAALVSLDRLHNAVRLAGASATDIRPMVGLSQPTVQSARLVGSEVRFEDTLDNIDYSGDGTVFRYSAAAAGTTPGYLPQTHGAIAKSPEALTFVEAVLTEEPLGPLEAEVTGTGLRVPDVVTAGAPFEIEFSSAAGFPSCRIQDVDTNLQVAAPRVEIRDGRLIAPAVLAQPGLYRIIASGGGLSPVEELACVIGQVQ